MKTPENRDFEFGPYRLNPAQGVLYREGKEIPLSPKAYEILIHLLYNQGHIIDKESLMQAVWPDTFVEEGNLKVNISALRKALGDTAERPLFIETVPRRGYRFVAAVRGAENGRHEARLQVAESVAPENGAQRGVVPEQGTASATEQSRATAAPARSSADSSRLLRIAAAAIAGLLALGAASYYLSLRPGKAVRVTLAGKKLQGWNSRDALAWEYEFPERMELVTLEGREGIVFADLRGDGEQEVLAPLANASSAGLPNMPHGALFCFSERGKLLWSYDPQIKFRFGKEEFGGPWALAALTLVREGTRQSVWVAFDHRTWWPAFVARIGPEGGAEVRFLNSGRIWFLRELRTPAGTFVVAGGTNNEYRQASLALVATDERFSISPQGQNTPYFCDGCELHAAPFYMLFPRSEIFELQNQPFHVVQGLEVTQDGFTVNTEEGKDETISPSFVDLLGIYRVSGNLQAVTGALSDSYWNLHRRLEREGNIHHRAADCPDQKIAGRVRVFARSSGWITAPQNAPGPAPAHRE